jgi:hypothetical protein
MARGRKRRSLRTPPPSRRPRRTHGSQKGPGGVVEPGADNEQTRPSVVRVDTNPTQDLGGFASPRWAVVFAHAYPNRHIQTKWVSPLEMP